MIGFIDRRKELERLREGLKAGENFVIVAPRRYGKTTLIKRVFKELEREGIKTLYIDVMPYADSVNALAEYIVDTAFNLLGIEGKIRKLMHIFNIKAKAVLKEEGIELNLEIMRGGDERKKLREALEFPERIGQKKGKRIAVAFDEFGELYKTNTNAVKLVRSVIQHHEKVSYIFAGSQETIMKKVFIDKSGAFFRFGTVIELGGLDFKDTLDYAVNNLGIDPAEFTEIFELLRGHPYYLVRVMEKIKGGADSVQALEELMNEERAYIELMIERLMTMKYALEILRTIAEGKNPYSIDGIKDQVINRVLNKLISYGYLRRLSKGIYQFTDPLLEIYLRK